MIAIVAGGLVVGEDAANAGLAEFIGAGVVVVAVKRLTDTLPQLAEVWAGAIVAVVTGRGE